MPVAGPWQWALVSTLVVLGVLFALIAWRMAVHEREQEPRIEVLSALGGGLITGLAVGLAVLFLQASFEQSQKYATWRANVEAAESIPGFTPGGRDIKGINFSGKNLRDADFRGLDLRGARFRDAVLQGATFDGADLEGAELIGADLEDASLNGADLHGALLQSTNMTHAEIGGVSPNALDGAQVNGRTCWPATVKTEQLRETWVRAFEDKRGHLVTPEQEQKEDGFKGGQKAPCPHLEDSAH
ncbi:pentapeptide repeat-containing protein [Streptomyces sp. Go40/10]|uniref:pentapeptide repeat-containing protein n=1 Tax=Streptomyces sp. Go40/10 TaxID=2825844 RepID=UPI001E41DC57|nr:pentapeptide repeat-containing protein [Streptomyces sp. Go40/10]UFR00306.1 pentapeptide repeat-containing protein [Streptomyces sp. Go40/10]